MPLDPAQEVILDHAVLATVREVLEGPMMDQMIEVLERTARETLVDLAASLEAKDLLRAQRHAHKLKGSAGNVGLKRIWAAAAQLESAQDLAEASAMGKILPGFVDEGLEQIKAAVANK